MSSATPYTVDVVLIGGGIMSATLGTVLRQLDPDLSIALLERLDGPAQESSDGWNNAGTGHAANCEMNYTTERDDGTIDIAKALEVNVEFDLSRQLWTHLVRIGAIPDPARFIQPCPHCSFVTGDENVAFLARRHATMSAHHCFEGMEHTQDHAVIADWAPLLMAGRDPSAPVAATRMGSGSDVDYGTLTHILLDGLARAPGFTAHYGSEDGSWLDLARSLRPGNVLPMLDVAVHSFKLEEYLADQVILSDAGRMETLRQFYPEADPDDWYEAVAGQRVQIIKPEGHGRGTLEFGTALVGAGDGSLVALMGASPGASTGAAIALQVLEKCFADRLTEAGWLPQLKRIIPTYGIDLREDAAACRRLRAETAPVLGLAQQV